MFAQTADGTLEAAQYPRENRFRHIKVEDLQAVVVTRCPRLSKTEDHRPRVYKERPHPEEFNSHVIRRESTSGSKGDPRGVESSSTRGILRDLSKVSAATKLNGLPTLKRL